MLEGATADGDGSEVKSKNRKAKKTTEDDEDEDDFDNRYSMDDYDDENGEVCRRLDKVHI